MPRKIIILAITSIIAIPLFASSITETFTFNQNDLTWEQVTIEGTTYDYAVLTGCNGYTAFPGAPTMPVKTVRFVIPVDDYVTGITITSLSTTSIDGSKIIMPGFDCHEDSACSFFVPPDSSYYISPYPQQIVQFVQQDWMSGYHVATICIYPLAYDPGRSKTILHTSITVELILEDGDNPDISPVYRDTLGGLYDIESSIKINVCNSSDVSSYRPSYTATSEKIRYLIVYNESETPGVADEMQRLANWYTHRGIKTPSSGGTGLFQQNNLLHG